MSDPALLEPPPVDEAGHIIHVSILRVKSSGQVLYLEAGKDFVDVLFNFLVLPVGTIIGLLNTEGVAKGRKFGAMDNIYKSVEKLQESMLYVDKKLLTKPKLDSPAFRGPELLQLLAPDQTNTPLPPSTAHHLCGSCHQYIGTSSNFSCPQCDYKRSLGTLTSKRPVILVPPKESHTALVSKPKEGYVKKSATYIVSNNLAVMPSSSIKSIDVLNKMKIQNLCDLQSIDEEIGRTDVLKILLAAISGSETPLSDVFDRKVTGSTS